MLTAFNKLLTVAILVVFVPVELLTVVRLPTVVPKVLLTVLRLVLTLVTLVLTAFNKLLTVVKLLLTVKTAPVFGIAVNKEPSPTNLAKIAPAEIVEKNP